MSRIEKRFAKLKAQNKTAFIPFIMAGDPDFETTASVLASLPAAGADIIEIGMPFSDPMADGPVIQEAGLRALNHNPSLDQIFACVKAFRANDADTPIILMGYYNPIYHYGAEEFCTAAADAGVDGMIIVDLPPEEEMEFVPHAKTHGLSLIKLITPTSDDARLDVILENASGFVYYVAVAGITGDASAAVADVGSAVKRIKNKTDLPVAVGFGLKTAEDVANIAGVADAAVVGSALVKTLEAANDAKNAADIASGFVRDLTSSL